MDGLDNDGDGAVDTADPGCALGAGTSEAADSERLACTDGLDNDGDGLIDHPDDPGCATPDDADEWNEPTARCSDGLDNDGDGLIDHPNDPGCTSPRANTERDLCPDDPRCPACGNQVDDDGDGWIDFPADPGCDTAADPDESHAQTTECGPDANLEHLLPGTQVQNAARALAPSLLVSPTCGGLGEEYIYRIDLDEPAILAATTEFAETTLDTVLYLRTDCRDATTELACSDDASRTTSRLDLEVDPGVYYLVVDAFHSTSAGDFTVRVDAHPVRGAACDPGADVCAPGHECRPRDATTTETTCEPPACRDGVDNDLDQLVDYPDEPGCTSPDDGDEWDPCTLAPTDPGCPACSNTLDDDASGQADFPADPGCLGPSDDTEIACPVSSEPVPDIVARTTWGTTIGAIHDTAPSCAPASSSADRIFALPVHAPLLSLSLSTTGSSYDTALAVHASTCDGPELACDDDSGPGALSSIVLTSVAPGVYFIVVDGADQGSGPFQLDVHGVIPAYQPCDPALVAAGLFACEPDFRCDGTCVPKACTDGLDNDGDGRVDHPDDPGCAEPGDPDESDDCPDGPGCPACANGLDDDGDGLADHPADLGCSAASDDLEENCEDTEPILELTAPTTYGSTIGATDDLTPACAYSAAPERVYTLAVPGRLESLDLDTETSTYDTLLYVRPGICDAPDLACDDDSGSGGTSAIHLTDVAPGVLHIAVDGYASQAGSYALHVFGVIATGEACDPAQITSGLLSCPSGTMCTDPGTGFTCN